MLGGEPKEAVVGPSPDKIVLVLNQTQEPIVQVVLQRQRDLQFRNGLKNMKPRLPSFHDRQQRNQFARLLDVACTVPPQKIEYQPCRSRFKFRIAGASEQTGHKFRIAFVLIQQAVQSFDLRSVAKFRLETVQFIRCQLACNPKNEALSDSAHMGRSNSIATNHVPAAVGISFPLGD